MSKIFKLRRGTTSTMNSTKSNILLSTGEMFLETPSNGINSGNGDCRIKVGDGENQYSDLSYSIGGPNMTFRDGEIIQQSGTNISSTTTSSSSSISTITTASNKDLSYVTSGYSLSQIIGSIKSAITRTNQGLTRLNSNINTINNNISTLNNDISNIGSVKSGITLKMTHTPSNTTGSATNATCYNISSNLVLIIGTVSVTATTSTNSNQCRIEITGGTLVNAVINAWVGGDTDSFLMYNGGVNDFYIHSSNTGSRMFYARIMGVITI